MPVLIFSLLEFSRNSCSAERSLHYIGFQEHASFKRVPREDYFLVAVAADPDPGEGLENSQGYKQGADEHYDHQQEHLCAQAHCAEDLRKISKTHRFSLRGSRLSVGIEYVIFCRRSAPVPDAGSR